MNLNQAFQIVPLIRIKPYILSICKDFQFQQLQNKINLQLKYNSKITHLNISNNNIEKIPQITNFITHLMISWCKLTKIDEIVYQNLISVDVSNNNLRKIPYLKSKNLRNLNLNNNEIEVLEQFLMDYHLLELKIKKNNLTKFYFQILLQQYQIQFELLNIYDLSRSTFIPQAYITLQQIIQSYTQYTNQQQLLQTILKAITLNYKTFIKYYFHLIDPALIKNLIVYAETQRLNDSLQQLLEVSGITQGFDEFRLESLNVNLLDLNKHYDLARILKIFERQPRNRQYKCEQFIIYLNNKKIQMINDQNLLIIFRSKNTQIINLIISLQYNYLKLCEFNNQEIIKAILELDNVTIINILLTLDKFKGYIFKYLNRQLNPFKFINSTFKIYKLLYKEEKKYIKQYLTRNILKFTEYDKIKKSSKVNQSTYIYPKNYEQYEQFNEWPLIPSNRPIKAQIQIQKQNQFVSMVKRVDLELKCNKNNMRQSMTALAILKHLNQNNNEQ